MRYGERFGEVDGIIRDNLVSSVAWSFQVIFVYYPTCIKVTIQVY